MNKILRSGLILLLSLHLFQLPLVSFAYAEAVKQYDEAYDEIAKEEEEIGFVPREIIVKFKKEANNGLSLQSIEKKMFSLSHDLEEAEKFDEKEVVEKFTIESLESLDSVIEKVSKSDIVEFVQPNFRYRPQAVTNDTFINDLWAIDASHNPSLSGFQASSDSDMDVVAAWTKFQEQEEVIVGVIDSGIDYTHEDLTDVMWDGSGTNGCKDDEGNFILTGCPNNGWDFNGNNDNNNPFPNDSSLEIKGHGTHVAGIIGAVQNNGKGVAGIGKGLKLMAIQNSLSTSDIIQGIHFAQNNGAKVINASFGDAFTYGVGYSHVAFDQALYNAIRDFPGLFIAAAGNDAQNHDSGDFTTKGFPSGFASNTTVNGVTWEALPNIISVASLAPDNSLSSFSDFGATSVLTAAPGHVIRSSYYQDGQTNAYTYANGTSMAAPYVSGLVASMISHSPNTTLFSSDASVTTIKSILLNSGDLLPSLSGKTNFGKRPNFNSALVQLDSEIVSNAKTSLIFDTIKNQNTAEDSISSNLTLPTDGGMGTVISWASDNTNVIAIDGAVTQPTFGSGNASVTLTATLIKNAAIDTQTFNLTVLEADPSDTESVALDKESLVFDTIKNTNEAEDSITENLTLPTSGANGTTITWASDNTDVIAIDGTVTRPLSTESDTAVTLIASITKNEESDTKVFTLTVLKAAQTDAESVALDKSALVFDSIKLENTAEDSITENLTLPTSGANGTTITWASDNTDVIAIDGTVNRPSFGLGNAAVVLTGTITKNTESDTKVFNFTVLEQEASDTELVALDKELLVFDMIKNTNAAEGSITDNLTLPTSGANGTIITWASDNTNVIAIDGTVTRPLSTESDVAVTLTASITKNEESDTKVFTLTVLKAAQTDAESVALDKSSLVFDSIKLENTAEDSITTNLDLPVSGSNGTIISWTSDNTDVIAIDGTVTRPLSTGEDTDVALTATITKNEVSDTKIFNLTVLALEEVLSPSIEAVGIADSSVDNINTILTLPSLPSGATQFVYTFSDSSTSIPNLGEILSDFTSLIAEQDNLIKAEHQKFIAVYALNDNAEIQAFIEVQAVVIHNIPAESLVDSTDISEINETSEISVKDEVTDVVNYFPQVENVKNSLESISELLEENNQIVVSKKQLPFAVVEDLDTSTEEFTDLSDEEKTNFGVAASETTAIISPVLLIPGDTSDTEAQKVLVSIPKLTLIKGPENTNIENVDIDTPLIKNTTEKIAIQSNITAPTNTNIIVKAAIEIPTSSSSSIYFKNTDNTDKYVDICVGGSLLDFAVNSAEDVSIYSSSDGLSWMHDTTIKNKQFIGDTFCFQTNHLTSFAAVESTVIPTSSASSSGGGSGGGGGGGSVSATSTIYTLPTTESTQSVLLTRSMSLKNTHGIFTRRVEMKNSTYEHSMTFKKGSQLTQKDGTEYRGEIIVPTPVSKINRPENPKGLYHVTTIKFGDKDSKELSSSEDIALNIFLNSNQEIDSSISVYRYDPEKALYTLVGGKLSEDKKYITAYTKQTGVFSVFYNKPESKDLSSLVLYQENEDFLSGSFKDLKGHWTKPYVETLAKRGVIQAQENFRPADFVTRAEMVKMIMKANGNTQIGFDLQKEFKNKGYTYALLKDVDLDSWYAPFVLSAIKQGVLSGYSDQSFRGGNYTTRAEMLKFVVEATKNTEKGKEIQKGFFGKNYTYALLKDVALDAWYAPFVLFAKQEGIISGYEDGTFQAGNYVTRAEAAKIISVAFE